MIKVIGVYCSSFVSEDGVVPYYQIVYSQDFKDGGSRVFVGKCVKDFYDNHADIYDSFYFDNKGRVIGGISIDV